MIQSGSEGEGSMNILILGGTQFFGKRLVHGLIQEGHQVTVATRGKTPDDFGDAVERLVVDRTTEASMRTALQGRAFDLVYDQLCFNPREAEIAVQALGSRVGRYVLTSSMAVYGHKDGETIEEDFDPSHYTYDLEAPEYSYAEGKRQAEAFFLQNAPFPVVAVRVAMVVSGTDDHTGRFDFYVQHAATGSAIGVLATEHPITYVTAWDVADFLRFIGTQSHYQGPINAANGGYLSIQQLSRRMAHHFEREAQFHIASLGDATLSPYAMGPLTWKISNQRARGLGYVFPDIEEALPGMVRDSAERMGLAPHRG